MLTVTYCAILKVQSVLKSVYCKVGLYNIATGNELRVLNKV